MEPRGPEHDSGPDGLHVEDFIATCAEVYVAHGDKLWACTQEQRGGAIWLHPREPLPVADGASIALWCPHATGMYRFTLDILEATETRLIATRSVDAPMSKRVAVRGRVQVPLALHSATSPDLPEQTARTSDLSRGGMRITTDAPLALDTEWDCVVWLWEGEEVRVRARVVRQAESPANETGHAYGLEFVGASVDLQRKLLDFVLTRADLPTEPGGAATPE